MKWMLLAFVGLLVLAIPTAADAVEVFTARPITDNSTLQWTVVGVTVHADAVNDSVFDPTAGNTSDRVEVAVANAQDQFNMNDSAQTTDVTTISIRSYETGTAANVRIQLNLIVDGSVNCTTTTDPNDGGTYAWFAATCPGDFTDTQIDGAVLEVKETKSGGGILGTARVATLYMNVTHKDPPVPPNFNTPNVTFATSGAENGRVVDRPSTNAAVNHSIRWTSTTLSFAALEINRTECTPSAGAQNITNQSISGTNTQVNLTWTVTNGCQGRRVRWRMWANDSDNDWNVTNVQEYTVAYATWNATRYVFRNDTGALVVVIGEGNNSALLDNTIKYNMTIHVRQNSTNMSDATANLSSPIREFPLNTTFRVDLAGNRNAANVLDMVGSGVTDQDTKDGGAWHNVTVSQKNYTFAGISNPSSTTNATNGTGGLSSPPNGGGTEYTTTMYTNASAQDGLLAQPAGFSTGVWTEFRFRVVEPPQAVANLTVTFNATTGCVGVGISNASVWNYRRNLWEALDSAASPSGAFVGNKQIPNATEYINDSTTFLAVACNSVGPGNYQINVDYIAVNVSTNVTLAWNPNATSQRSGAVTGLDEGEGVNFSWVFDPNSIFGNVSFNFSAEGGANDSYFNNTISFGGAAAATTTTFTVRMPVAYRDLPIDQSAEGSANITHWISFNDTAGTGLSTCLEPQTEGASANIQTGNSRPIFWVDNTGNVNITIWMRVNSTNVTEAVLHVNSSCYDNSWCERNTTGGNNHCRAVPLNTTYFPVIEINTTSFGNISLFANLTSLGLGPGNFGPRRIFLNSSDAGA